MDIAAFVLAIVATIIGLGSMVVAWQQLAAARDASRAQNILTVLQFIHDDGFRQARGVLQRLAGPSSSWSTQDKEQARRACAACDMLAALTHSGVIPPHIADEALFLPKCYKIAVESGYLEEAQKDYDGRLWPNFRKLGHELSLRP